MTAHRVYADHAATTPLSKAAFEAMLQFEENRRRLKMEEGTACAILLELQEIKRILQQIAAKMA
jgi:hypothetical protein